MAFITMTASLLGSSTAITTSKTPTGPCRRVVMTRAMRVQESSDYTKETNTKRRDLVFAAAAAAVCSVAKIATAEEEPARGTPEAKKKYNAVCVSNPTARVCRK